MEKYCELKDGYLLVHVPRELDHHHAGSLRMEADLMIDAYRIKKIVFDFAGTEFMDSSGIGVIIGRSRSMGYCGGEVTARNVNERIRKIFTVSGLHRIVKTESGTAGSENRMESNHAE